MLYTVKMVLIKLKVLVASLPDMFFLVSGKLAIFPDFLSMCSTKLSSLMDAGAIILGMKSKNKPVVVKSAVSLSGFWLFGYTTTLSVYKHYFDYNRHPFFVTLFFLSLIALALYVSNVSLAITAAEPVSLGLTLFSVTIFIWFGFFLESTWQAVHGKTCHP